VAMADYRGRLATIERRSAGPLEGVKEP
jgi:hypothetical protein